MHLFNLGYVEGDTAPYWNIDWTLGPGSHGDDVKLVQYLLCLYGFTNSIQYPLSEIDGVWGEKTSAVVTAMENSGERSVVRDGFITPLPEPFTHNTLSNKAFKLSILLENYCRRTTGFSENELGPERLTQTMLAMPYDGQCPPDLAAALTLAIARW